ncbi:SDR family NAD(P)-dependent oxidoreductase [Hyphomonas sp. FCG-A18]|uniref:SDR family NAD(P)-dependent oxidoreductase n=1 Tax=Hyphomonas sp. FCG-A18 TaxID=3080019 RepID=UPI002B32001D|nr:SDR family NAD(P)-dependent oxidoreductase [Hyphomonas sp. FCG-A18]
MTEIAGKVAFITGGAGGLGLAMARAFAAKGAKVMLADRDAEGLSKAAAALAADGVDVGTVTCDVTDVDALKAAAAATIERFGKVHIVANNAGVAVGGQPGEIPLEDWRWIVDINLMGVAYGVEIFTPLIEQHGEGGHIVNTASMAGHVAMPGMGPYHATKYAVVGYSEALNVELGPRGIGVSVLCPAWVKTNIHNTGFDKPSGGMSREEAQSDPQYQQMASVIDGGLDADLVGGWVTDCVEADRLYIFTHPTFAPFIEAKYGQIKADYDAAAQDGRFEGV